MLHLFKTAASRTITFGLIALLAIGLLVGAVRLVLPFADLFRSELEEMLSETLGLQVRVGRLGLRLAGYVPQLSLRDVQLLNPKSGHSELSLKQLRVDLNLAATLRELAPHIEALTLVGAQLAIKRMEDGTILVAGLEGMEKGDPEGMTFFLGNGRFLLTDSDLYWIDESAGASPLHLADARIQFDNRGARHRIGILARPFGDQQTHLQLVGDMRGEPGKLADWKGEIYLHWQGGSLDQVLNGRLPPGLRLESDTVELESWNDLEGKVVTQSLNRITAKGLTVWSMSGDDRTAPLRLDKLGGLLRWRLAGSGWQLDVGDLTLTRGGTPRPASDLGIHFLAGDDGSWSIEGGNEFLNLEDVSDLLTRIPQLLPEAFDLLGGIRPEGELHDLRFRFLHRPEQPPSWAASVRVEDLSLEAHAQVPSIAGLTAALAANEHAGSVVLASDGLTLDLPHLFPNPVRLDEAAGKIRWQRDVDGALRVRAQEIVAANTDLATRSRFSVSMPADGGSPFLDLHTEFRDIEVASVRRYIPSKRLKKKLASWLDRALLGGRIPSGALLFRGPIADFPFEERQGRFQVLFGVEDCTLDFHRDWPRLEALIGEVRFEDRKMEIFVSEGRFLDSELANVSARIPNLKEAVAIEIEGRAEGPFADNLRVLGETPLRKKLGAVARALTAEGVARLDLDMAIPLRYQGRKGPLRLAGELTWPDQAALTVKGKDIKLTDLAGTLHFTDRTLEAQSIEAKLWDVPVRLGIETREPPGDTGLSTRIQTTGSFPVSVLARQFPTGVWELVKGRTDLELLLDVGRADMAESVPPMDFELKSDLTGIAVELPAPLGKLAAGTRQLRFSGRLTPGEAFRTQGGYGDLGISLGLERRGDGKLRLTRGTFNLGGDAKPLPKGEGLYLSGSIATLNLPAWLNWWANREPSAGGSLGGSTGLRSADLGVTQLVLPDAAFNNVRLDLDSRGDRWEAKIEARELDGKITIPHRPRREPIQVHLGRLDLKSVLGHEGEEGQAFGNGRRSDPRQTHTLDLRIEDLLWGDNRLGRVTLRSQALPDGLDFAEVALAGPFMSIQGQGSWKQTGEGQHTSLSLSAKGSDLGEFLRSLEFKSLFHKAPAEVDLDLDWTGGPFQFSAADLKGRIRIDVGAGSLLDVEPGVGRVLGILNLEALQKRLTLDFSDLFARGYAFEKIFGEIEVGKGEATIKDLAIEGPSANVSIAGSANLVDRELDQIVTVTPRIGTGVAIASAVAGGPLVGAAVYLADQVSGGAVDKLGRHQYVLSGPWTEPAIRRGRLGGESEQDAAPGHFLQDSGRGGASASREPKPPQAQAKSPAETNTEELGSSPPLFQGGGDDNLFLEGH